MRFDTRIWPNRLKAVELEYQATRFATHDVLRRARLDSSVLIPGVDVGVLVKSINNLEGTYTVRIFSEFETGLRSYWNAVRQKEPPSRAKDLINGIASYCRIPFVREFETHAIREYRNYLVHERDDEFVPLSLSHTRSQLCRFLSFLR